MSDVNIVVGAGFGNEGKGLMVDYFCAKHPADKTIVVRCNGNNKSSHTVTSKDVQYIFWHYGSGALYGCSTYLTDCTIIEPLLLAIEARMLPNTTPLFVHKDAPLHIPYDNMVGLLSKQPDGFYESIQRNFELPLTIADALRYSDIELQHYFEQASARASVIHQMYNIGYDDSAYKPYLVQYLEALAYLRDRVVIVDNHGLLDRYVNIVFENAYGIQRNDNTHCPYTDYGVRNPLHILADTKHTQASVVYVSRAYGVKSVQDVEECDDPHKIGIHVRNDSNPGQCYSELNHSTMFEAISVDYDNTFVSSIVCDKRLAITCLDHLSYTDDAIIQAYYSHLDFDVGYISFGPTRNDVLYWEG